LAANPAVGVILPQPPDADLTASPQVSLNDAERNALIRECLRRENGQLVHRLGDLLAFLALTGVRSGEAQALTYDDVDLGDPDNPRVSITKTISIGKEVRLGVGPPKRKSSKRSIELPRPAANIVRARAREAGIGDKELGALSAPTLWVRTSEGTFLSSSRVRPVYIKAKGKLGEQWMIPTSPSSGQLIWMTSHGTPFDHQALRKALHEIIRSVPDRRFNRFRCQVRRSAVSLAYNWKQAPRCQKCAASHWPPFSPHALRGVAISFWLRHYPNAVAVAERAGHSDPRMLLKFYASSTREEDSKLASLDD
jgi:integrase